jgi:SepF-like predicted cell division protein (DUF552 family)
LSELGNPIDKDVHKIKKTEESKKVVAETFQANVQNKVYLKALPLRTLDDLANIKCEVKSGNILILKVSPLAKKSIDEVKQAVSELIEFTMAVGGDIARLGEERVVITPAPIKVWREKTVAPNRALHTAA